MKKYNLLGVLTLFLGIFVSFILSFNLRKVIDGSIVGVIFTICLLFCMFVSAIFFAKSELPEQREKEQMKKEKIQKLEEKYADYVSLVNEIQSKYLKGIKEEEVKYGPFISTGNDYLILYEKYIDWVCENRIIGKPDTFIEATCLMYSLIKKPRILGEEIAAELDRLGDFHINQIISHINCKIALDVALKLISEPTTYYEDEIGEWIPQKHTKVNIIVPDVLIEKSTLYDRIVNTIVKDYDNGMDYYIMQFSNLLHLIYLNCK